MTKEEARQEAVRLWRELPTENRQIETAGEFAALLSSRLDFHTLGDRRQMIAAWLLRDLLDEVGSERLFSRK